MSRHIERSFQRYDQDNPQVYALFKEYAKRALRAGREVLSANLIFERIRWLAEVETSGDGFKVNNNYRAYYARKFMEEFPQYGECFRTRQVGYA
ncbi:hypothetical protein Lo5R7ANS_17 [Mesorhizobium phage vB_MloP_Lo5R7ANS]|uniref:Uncharacterized protein n=1 Tax=Mesorhizobium phage vB_MloP_Lo5R7ANS TaxID=1527771 RepID=A0A076YL32_9CAUD|nr:hypothetical protein Lo5R7ANS_17 [Mesorhizobium phage vB_MloP_Lo5R7ANS]AIK68487.1 hypothetical protein Lo5R7ANS_17 [Mesorhizobium phage vB_MloP_Lo5R7ANS]